MKSVTPGPCAWSDGQAVQDGSLDGPGGDSLVGDNSKTPLDPLPGFTTLASVMELTVVVANLLLFLALECGVEAQVEKRLCIHRKKAVNN